MQKLNNVERALKQFRESVLDSPRIAESLKRYDAWHLRLARSENLRWIIFDFLVPLSLGLVALILLRSAVWELAKRGWQYFF